MKYRYKLMGHTLFWDHWLLRYGKASPQDLFKAKQAGPGVKCLSPGRRTCDLLRPEFMGLGPWLSPISYCNLWRDWLSKWRGADNIKSLVSILSLPGLLLHGFTKMVIIFLNNCPIWKIKKRTYSGQQLRSVGCVNDVARWRHARDDVTCPMTSTMTSQNSDYPSRASVWCWLPSSCYGPISKTAW